MDNGVSSSDDRAVVNEAPDAGRLCYEGDYPPVTHQQAHNCASDLIAHFFKNKPRKGGGVLISIPARPNQDTDLLLMRYIRESERLERAFRIRVWNYAKGLGASDELAMHQVEEEVAKAKEPPAQGIEARQGGDGTAPSSDESPTPQGDAPNTTQKEPTHDE